MFFPDNVELAVARSGQTEDPAAGEEEEGGKESVLRWHRHVSETVRTLDGCKGLWEGNGHCAGADVVTVLDGCAITVWGWGR